MKYNARHSYMNSQLHANQGSSKFSKRFHSSLKVKRFKRFEWWVGQSHCKLGFFFFCFCSCHFVSDIHFKIITCREILLHEGIWDMIRVDHGTEACLMLFVQNLLRNERGNLGCEPYVQTQSRQVSTLFILFFLVCTQTPLSDT